jgi:ketosteroid isomerase-like protein
MSQENMGVVRQPVAVKAHSRRRLEERVGVRFPRVLALVARAVFRLPPGSRLRKARVRRTVQLGYEATNRGDFEAAFMVWRSDCESIFPRGFATLGVELGTRGREERIEFQRRWTTEWGELRFEPGELIDLGASLLILSRMKGSGLGSAAPFDSECAHLVTLAAGGVIREQIFLHYAEALEAAGLRE